jgi:AbrB family looped-hinge helix DNA binding protein
MEATLSSKGQIVLPAAARRSLRLTQGERLSVELHKDGILLRLAHPTRTYHAKRHPVSGMPYMVADQPVTRKVTAAEIARLNADLIV